MKIQNTHKKWKSIPDHLYQVSDLSTLDISFNEIREIDSSAKNWSVLTHLDLSHNYFSVFPDQIRSLTSLRVLNLGNNPIKDIPPWICELVELEVLIMTHCQLDNLSNIKDLLSLKKLDISYNPIIQLPMSLRTCTKLSSLKMIGNRCHSFPLVLSYLPLIDVVKDLDLSHRLKVTERFLKQLLILFKRLHKKSCPEETRLAAIHFFIENRDIPRLHVYDILALAPSVLRKKIKEYLIEISDPSSISIEKVAILGDCSWIDGSYKSSQQHVKNSAYIYLGDNISKGQISWLTDSHQFINDRVLFDCLYAPKVKFEDEILQNRLIELLLSGIDSNILLAIQIVDDALFWDSHLEELFIAYTFVSISNTSLRRQIKQIFRLCHSDFPVDSLPSPAFTFRTKRSEEELCRILIGVNEVFHCIDSFKIALFLFEQQRVGYIYILRSGNWNDKKRWLSQFLTDGLLCLSSCKKLKELPILDETWGAVTYLDLRNCTFRKLPSIGVLRMFPRLRVLDLRNNPIRFLPHGIHTDYASYQILLTRKK